MSASQQDINAAFEKMQSQFKPEKAKDMDATIQFNLSGDENITYWVQIEGENVEMHEGATDDPDMTLIAKAQDFADVVYGHSNAMQAFMSGKLKVKGNMGLAMKLQSIFGL